MSTRVQGLLKLGPRSCEMLYTAGLRTETVIRELGAARSYLAVKACNPGASLNLLWAIEGALTGRHWRTVAREDRMRLLMEIDDLQSERIK